MTATTCHAHAKREASKQKQSEFCGSTGIIVKPEKSYVYSSATEQDNSPIIIEVFQGDGNFGVGKVERTELKDLDDASYWRHLGNIQNSLGQTKIGKTKKVAKTK